MLTHRTFGYMYRCVPANMGQYPERERIEGIFLISWYTTEREKAASVILFGHERASNRNDCPGTLHSSSIYCEYKKWSEYRRNTEVYIDSSMHKSSQYSNVYTSTT